MPALLRKAVSSILPCPHSFSWLYALLPKLNRFVSPGGSCPSSEGLKGKFGLLQVIQILALALAQSDILHREKLQIVLKVQPQSFKILNVMWA